MIYGVVFDMDGVLFDSERTGLLGWREIAKKYGIKDIDESFRKIIGVNHVGGNRIFHEIYGEDFPYEKYRAEALQVTERIRREEGIILKPGVVETLETLKAEGYKLALASSTDIEMVRSLLGKADLLKYFDVVIGGNLIKNSKPAPDIYLAACEKMGIPPKECFGVEDSPNGVRSSAAAGLYTVMVPDLLPATEELENLCYRVITTLFELSPLIKSTDL